MLIPSGLIHPVLIILNCFYASQTTTPTQKKPITISNGFFICFPCSAPILLFLC